MLDAIIAGQGIAGTVLALRLEAAGLDFRIFDPSAESTASRIAAGMFSPYSGKRFVADPQALEHQQAAILFYREMEALLGCSFLELKPLTLIFSSAEESQRFFERHPYREQLELLPDFAKAPFGAVTIPGAGRLDCRAFLTAARERFRAQNRLLERVMDAAGVQADGVRVGGLHARHLIYCTGYPNAGAAYFPEARIVPCKGDLLRIRHDHEGFRGVLKSAGIYFVADRPGSALVGATYRWEEDWTETDPEAAVSLSNGAQSMLKAPVEIEAQYSAIRPTTRDRKPLLLSHPEWPVHCFNGLGTKGVSLAPWYAVEMAARMRK